MCYILAEVVEPPSDTTVFLDHTAVFLCGTRGSVYGYWIVNGTAHNDLPLAIRDDLEEDQYQVGDIEVYTLTIPGRAEYNGTVIQNYYWLGARTCGMRVRGAAPKTIYACALATSITFDPDSKQAEGSNHAQPNINRIGPLNDAQDISAL